MKTCILDETKECNNCGECRCELDPNKICDNCFRCLDENQKAYADIQITDVFTEPGGAAGQSFDAPASIVWDLKANPRPPLVSTLDRRLHIVRRERRKQTQRKP